MTGDHHDHDAHDLIERLRTRAADPDGRTDYRPSVFESNVRAMSLGDLFSAGRSMFGDLMKVVQTNQSGLPPDPETLGRAEQFERDMSTPTPSPDLQRATAEAVLAAEEALALTIPPMLARVYMEVADGGFGPGGGLLSLDEIVRQTRELRSGDIVPRNREWPATYLPLVHLDPGWACVDTATGAILEWDPEDMTERMSEERWRETFSEVAPSVEAWLTKWLARRAAADRKPSEQERWDRMVARAQTPQGQRHQLAISRRHLEQVSPEDRAKYGLDKLLDDLEADLDAEDAARNR
jgi:hypothetical protein